MLDYFKDLIAYSAWADAEFFRVWKSLDRLHKDDALRLRTDHLISVQLLFLNAILDQPYAMRASDAPLPEFIDLHHRSHESHEKWNELIGRLVLVDLEKPIRASWFRNQPVQPTFGEAITQTVMHTQHHRAQNMAALAQHGSEKTIVDYIVWTIKGRPHPQWTF